MNLADRYPFKLELQAKEYECDLTGVLSVTSLARYVQEVSTAHLVEMSLGYERLYSEGIVFLLAAVGMKIVRRPKPGEKVTIATCPCAVNGVSRPRETLLLDENGDLLIENQSAWVMVDPVSRTILRPSKFTHTMPQLEDYSPFIMPTKIKPPSAKTLYSERTVRVSDLDRNKHLNNTVYYSVALDCLPDIVMAGNVSEIQMRFRSEAKLGDKILLYCDRTEKSATVSGFIGDTPCFDSYIAWA